MVFRFNILIQSAIPKEINYLTKNWKKSNTYKKQLECPSPFFEIFFVLFMIAFFQLLICFELLLYKMIFSLAKLYSEHIKDFYCNQRQYLMHPTFYHFQTHRAQTESVTFLGNHSENTRNLYAIPGLDYVAHEVRSFRIGFIYMVYHKKVVVFSFQEGNYYITKSLLKSFLLYLFCNQMLKIDWK